MSSIDLIILGLVLKEPCSAYDLARFMGDNHFDNIVKISTPAVYKNTLKLAEKGYLEASVRRAGKNPEKTIYTVTPEGKRYLESLLSDISKGGVKFHFDFNTAIMSLDNVSKADGLRILDDLGSTFLRNRAFFEKAMDEHADTPFVGRMIIRQHRMLNETLLEWLDEVEAEYRRDYEKIVKEDMFKEAIRMSKSRASKKEERIHDEIMKKMGISEEEDKAWHKKHKIPKTRSR